MAQRRIQVFYRTVEMLGGSSLSALRVWHEVIDRDDVHAILVEQSLSVLKSALKHWHLDHPAKPVNVVHMTRLTLIALFHDAVLSAQLFA